MHFFLIFIAGLVGIFGHWATRWEQQRTQSPFKEYLLGNKAYTIRSLFANLTSTLVIYSTAPDDLTGKPLILVLIGAYMAGYTLDSKFNKEAQQTLTPSPVHAEIARENASKSLDQILDEDRRL